MSKEKIDCLHYNDELGCCIKLSDWSDPMPTLRSCVGSPCEHYVENEKCGTCVKFFDYYQDGCGEKCSSPFYSEKCRAYEPVNYCFMCGRKLRRKNEQREAD